MKKREIQGCHCIFIKIPNCLFLGLEALEVNYLCPRIYEKE